VERGAAVNVGEIDVAPRVQQFLNPDQVSFVGQIHQPNRRIQRLRHVLRAAALRREGGLAAKREAKLKLLGFHCGGEGFRRDREWNVKCVGFKAHKNKNMNEKGNVNEYE